MGPPGQKFEGVFKVQLNKGDCSDTGEKVAVQRFRINIDRNVLLQTLKEKIYNGFKELQQPNVVFEIFWKDSDEKCIRISDNDGLLDALNEIGGVVFSIFAVMYGGDNNPASFGSSEEIKVEYSPPTIDEEKIVESLKDRNRMIMKQISRADLEYDDLILFAKHFGILYRKLKGGMFGKELSLNAVACRGRLVFYDDDKTLLNSISPNKESKERIEIIVDKDPEKFEFILQDQKFKFRVPEKEERSMWINAIDIYFNCRCKRDDLMCKNKTCNVIQDDDEEWDTPDDNIEIVDWEERWSKKLRMIPASMDPSYEYYPDFGSSSTISVEEDTNPSETNAKPDSAVVISNESDEDVYTDCEGGDPESCDSSEDIYVDDGLDENSGEGSDDKEVTYGSDFEIEEIEKEPEIDPANESKDTNRYVFRQTSMNERKAKFESAPIQNIPKSSAVTNEKDQVDVSEKLATLPARKIFESKNDQKCIETPPMSLKEPDVSKQIKTEQTKGNEFELSSNTNSFKQDDKKEFDDKVKPQSNKHEILVNPKHSFQTEKSKPVGMMKMGGNKPEVPRKSSTLKQLDEEKLVKIVKEDANEHGVPLKPTNLKSFFDKLEAKSNEEDPAAIRAKLSIKKKNYGVEESKAGGTSSKDHPITTKAFKAPVSTTTGPKKIVIPKAFS